MHGVKIPEKATDDMPTEELPYLELLYRFVFGERSYYNLEITKDVKPKAKDNDDEEELRQRGEGGRSQKAIKDLKRGRCRCEGTQSRNDRSKSMNILTHLILREKNTTYPLRGSTP